MRFIVLFVAIASLALAAQGAPIIDTQPGGQTNIVGDATVFIVDARGSTNELFYQWRKNGINLNNNGRIFGATEFYLSISGVTASDAGDYSVRITDPADNVNIISSNAYLKVVEPPGITQQPVSKTVIAGSSVTFTVRANGTEPLRYQWFTDGVEIPGATNLTLTLTNVQADQAGDYTAVVSNEADEFDAVSDPATLTVLVPPQITYQPESVVAVQGDDVEFSVDINDDATDTYEYPLTYQWRKNGASISEETDSILTLYDITASQKGNYTVKIMNAAGWVISSNAMLTVYIPPEITTQPASKIVKAGDAVTFTVKATGTPLPLGYQWLFEGDEIAGQTNSTLTFVVTDPSQAGAYSVTVSNATALFDEDYITYSDDAILTVQTETVKPAVTIAKPAEGARWTNATVNVEGKATDNVAVQKVLWQVNGGDWQQVANLTGVASAAWSALSVPLVPGTNIFRTQAFDTSGNKSAFVDRRIFYAVPSLFTLLTNGLGTVTFNPAVKTNKLEIGRAYTVTAKPGTGQVFAGWKMGVVSNNSTLTFLMRSGLVLQANFIANPFTKSVYNGLFYQNSGVTHDTAGFFTMTLTDKGLYSGKLLLGGGSYPFKGALWVDGTSATSVTRKGLSTLALSFRVDLTNGTDQVQGSVNDRAWVAALEGDRQVFASPQTGKYTAALLHTTNHVTVPGGDGSGVITVSSVGLLKFTGVLADGTKVTQSVGISKDGQWPFYLNLYKGKGSTLGWGTFTNRDTSSIEGNVLWIKPVEPGKFYPNGFTTEVQILGSHYAQPPRGERVLDINTSEVVFSDSGLAAPLTNSVFLTTNNIITVPPGTNKLMLKFTLSTGAASGSFIHPITKKSSVISGVLLPEDNTLRGSFLSTNLSGSVILRATSP